MADNDNYLHNEYGDEYSYAKTQENFNKNNLKSQSNSHSNSFPHKVKKNKLKLFSIHYKEKLSSVKEKIESSVFI